MGKFVFNTLFVTSLVVFLTVIVGTMAGFALSKLNFKLKKAIFRIQWLIRVLSKNKIVTVFMRAAHW